MCRSFHSERFWELSLYRVVLGIGADGVYPLAALLSPGKKKSFHKLVLTFSMQGLGFIAVPIIALLLRSTTSNLSLVWRILLGVGGVPGIALLLLNHRCNQRTDNHDEATQMDHDDEEVPRGSTHRDDGNLEGW
jgi:MFS transporter, PHS family, inorganic phosphate transporter